MNAPEPALHDATRPAHRQVPRPTWRAAATLLCCALLVSPALTAAAEPGTGTTTAAVDEPTPTDPPASAEKGPAEQEPARADPANTATESPEVFVPSEEISEDFTVSFPVDI